MLGPVLELEHVPAPELEHQLMMEKLQFGHALKLEFGDGSELEHGLELGCEVKLGFEQQLPKTSGSSSCDAPNRSQRHTAQHTMDREVSYL